MIISIVAIGHAIVDYFFEYSCQTLPFWVQKGGVCHVESEKIDVLKKSGLILKKTAGGSVCNTLRVLKMLEMVLSNTSIMDMQGEALLDTKATEQLQATFIGTIGSESGFVEQQVTNNMQEFADVDGMFFVNECKESGVQCIVNVEQGKTGVFATIFTKKDTQVHSIKSIVANPSVATKLNFNQKKYLQSAEYILLEGLLFVNKNFDFKKTLSQLTPLCKKIIISASAPFVVQNIACTLIKTEPFWGKNYSIMLVCNNDEAKILSPYKLELLKYNVSILETRGADGAYFFNGKNSEFVACPDAEQHPLDETGAGDAFLAGFLWASFHNKSVKTSLSYAHKIAKHALFEYGCTLNPAQLTSKLTLIQ